MTEEPKVPKQMPNNPATAKRGRLNPIRMDKPLVPRPASTTPGRSVPAQSIPAPEDRLDATSLESATSTVAVSPPVPPSTTSPARTRPVRRFRIPLPSWQILFLIGFIGTGTISAAVLFRSPALPNCPAIFWPMASASLRLYCAQIAANKQTPEDLLEAITLVKSLPADHPLQAEVQEYLEEWSQDLLDVANDLFHEGRLLDAIEAAMQVPPDSEAKESAQQRIERWQKIWTSAVKTYQAAEDELREGNWRTAFQIGSRLTFVGNTYWETIQFETLNQAVKQTQQDITRYWEARDLADEGGVKNLLEAMRKLALIPDNSYLRAKVIAEQIKVGDTLLELAQESLDRQDLQEALDIVAQIPNVGNLQQKARDLGTLANAQARAWSESLADLEAAIKLAQQIDRTSPLYDRAQGWIQRWQSEITAVPTYNQAQQLAAQGTLNDLRSAIATVNQIPSDNPLWKKISSSVEDWQEQVALLEDRPVLDEAIRLSEPGGINALQTAINIASQIQSGRPLYAEARDRMRTWQIQVEQIQDQPLIDQARAIANQGDFASAVSIAQQIRPGRSLSAEAQGLAGEWQAELNGQQSLAVAQQSANQGTVDGLISAIRNVNQVPRNSSSYPQSLQFLDQWSSDLLGAAQDTANYDLARAIELADQIPRNASNYSIAQQLIRSWENQLYPPAPPPVVEPEPEIYYEAPPTVPPLEPRPASPAPPASPARPAAIQPIQAPKPSPTANPAASVDTVLP